MIIAAKKARQGYSLKTLLAQALMMDAFIMMIEADVI
jgi:hypothetical protein